MFTLDDIWAFVWLPAEIVVRKFSIFIGAGQRGQLLSPYLSTLTSDPNIWIPVAEKWLNLRGYCPKFGVCSFGNVPVYEYLANIWMNR